MRKVYINLFKILLSVAFLYFVFRKIPFRDIKKVWSAVNVFFVILAMFFFLASQVLSVKRLEFYLKANDFNLSFKMNTELYFLGMLYNFFIPGGVGGDAYKIYILHKKMNWNVKKLTSSVFNDRLSGLLAICVLMLFFTMFLLPVQWLLVSAVLIVAGILLTFFVVKKLFAVYQNIFLTTFFLSILVQVLQIMCFVLLLKGLGINGNFTIYILTFLGSSVLSLVSFAGIGVREFLFLQASIYFEFDASVLVSASLLFTAVTIFFSLFGIIPMLRGRLFG